MEILGFLEGGFEDMERLVWGRDFFGIGKGWVFWGLVEAGEVGVVWDRGVRGRGGVEARQAGGGEGLRYEMCVF